MQVNGFPAVHFALLNIIGRDFKSVLNVKIYL